MFQAVDYQWFLNPSFHIAPLTRIIHALHEVVRSILQNAALGIAVLFAQLGQVIIHQPTETESIIDFFSGDKGNQILVAFCPVTFNRSLCLPISHTAGYIDVIAEIYLRPELLTVIFGISKCLNDSIKETI